MGLNERKEKEKQIRRNDIIDAAEAVFFSKGYDVATMDDVARKAEFSKRTVYVYFNSKEQLYFEIMVRGYRILIEMIEAALNDANNKNAIEKIKLIGNTLYQFNIAYPNYFYAIMSYENGEKDFVDGITDESREECYVLGEKLFDYFTATLLDGVEEGLIRGDIDIKNTAIILWSCTIGLFNTLIKKRNYIQNYHERSSEKLIIEGLDLLLFSINNKNGELENEKEV